MEPRRSCTRAIWSSSPAIQGAPIASIPSRAWNTSVMSSCPCGWICFGLARNSSWTTVAQAPRLCGSRRKNSSRFRTAARRGSAALAGLRDPDFMARKAKDEADLRNKVQEVRRSLKAAAGAWDKIAAAEKFAAEIVRAYFYLERGYAFDSKLFDIARTLVRLAEEKAKPNADRLKEYRESALQSLELELFSEAPIYPEFEQAKLAESLAHWKATIPATRS